MADTSGTQSTPPRPIASGPLSLKSIARLPLSVGGNLARDTMSPVNQNGSFEFDRVIKSGVALKRTKRTKSWKPIHLVLRPHLLSIYRDAEEMNLRHNITLSDLTAVARQKDPKGKAQHVFGLFSPSRNFHLDARTDTDAQEWVALIRREARIDEEESDLVLATPSGAKSTFQGFERHVQESIPYQHTDRHANYSSSEAEPFSQSKVRQKMPAHVGTLHSARRPSHTLDYSGTEHASYSDFSDSAGPTARMSALSLSHPERARSRSVPPQQPHAVHAVYGAMPPSSSEHNNQGEPSGLNVQDQKQVPPQDQDRVVCQGWVYLLKSTSGVRQWKKLWMVLRLKALALYKNEEEYAAVLVLSFSNIIDAVDIDPVSRSKRFCMQVLSEERNYRVCASDEDDLAKWLGAFKSLLVKRKERQMQQEASK